MPRTAPPAPLGTGKSRRGDDSAARWVLTKAGYRELTRENDFRGLVRSGSGSAMLQGREGRRGTAGLLTPAPVGGNDKENGKSFKFALQRDELPPATPHRQGLGAVQPC